MSRRHKLNAAARREAARAEAERQQRARARRRVVTIVVAALAVVVLVGGGLLIWQGSTTPTLDDVDRAPQGSDATGGIPVSAEGVAGVENPTAPRLDVYVDLASPESIVFWQTNGADVVSLSESGSVSLWLHVVGDADRGTEAGEAAALVADEAPEQFVPFLQAAFEALGSSTPTLEGDALAEVATGVGVPQEVVDQFADNPLAPWFEAATAQSEIDGATTHPTILLDNTTLGGDWTTEGALMTAVTDILGDIPTPEETVTE